MQSEGPHRQYDGASRHERYLEGCVLFPIGVVLDASFRLVRWLVENPVGRALVGCVRLLEMIVWSQYARLSHWLHPVRVRLSQDGSERGGVYLIRTSGWYLFENATESEVRLRVGHERGKLPKELRDQGVLLQPGQQQKIFFPRDESSYDIEVYGRDGRIIERMKLAVLTHYYED